MSVRSLPTVNVTTASSIIFDGTAENASNVIMRVHDLASDAYLQLTFNEPTTDSQRKSRFYNRDTIILNGASAKVEVSGKTSTGTCTVDIGVE